MAADPDRFRPAAEALVAEARRRPSSPEALALALRAVAWAGTHPAARIRAAIRLLDEACRIARLHHFDDVLAELLMSHAAVSQELGRVTVARRDLRAAAMLVTGTRILDLELKRAVACSKTRGTCTTLAAIYHRILSDPAAAPLHAAQCANNLALISPSRAGTGGPCTARAGAGGRRGCWPG